MYNGLLPKGLTEDDLSSGDEEEDDNGEERKEKTEEEKLESSVMEAQPNSDPPTGISQEMWQKFQDLRKKNEEMKAMKIPRRRKRRRHKKGTDSEEPAESRECQEERQKHWDELKQYFGVNDRFDPPACSKPPPKSGLEKSIERAVAEGDIAKAEEMSDRLATRELAVKIAQAADCRDFVQRKQEAEALRAAQKRKNEIVWGFEAKKRWETKSNMGYM
ncbi:protein FAM204A isoform X2 [Echeneis naucrates]|uniref:protein FAM204A isoform X2 n=1 Tax=Echeneis naucrates TaxID=173247 RepID=UPI0011143091|nr:protein FAM204A isoform X2 [Echeneis naucrates]